MLANPSVSHSRAAFPRLFRASSAALEELLGLEHEFVVRNEAGPVDFRTCLHRLHIPGRRVDPYDPHAYRCPWGGTITADDAEAEVAIAPVDRIGGFADVVDARARGARQALEAVLPADLALEGYSTHISVSNPDDSNDETARWVARRFSAALILLTGRAISPGLLVMPRPGRTELGVEYVEGSRLRAATAMAAGSVLASVRAAAREGGASALPPALDVEIRPAVRRFGWYVDRAAFGTDLLTHGRSALLRRLDGGTITAGDHLQLAWDSARRALGSIAAPGDLADADRMVDGTSPLPTEDLHWADPTDRPVASPPTPFSELLVPRHRPGFVVEVAVATWDFAVFTLVGLGRTGYAAVPRSALHDFFVGIDAGRLDSMLREFLAGPDRGRILAGWREAHLPGLYDGVAPLAAFAPPERDPTGDPWVFDLSVSLAVPPPSSVAAASVETPTVETTTLGLPTKLGKVPVPPPPGTVPEQPSTTSTDRPGGLRLWWIVVIGIAILTLVGGGLVLTGGHGGTPPAATPPASSGSGVAPSSLASPTPGPVGLGWTGTTVELTFTNLTVGQCATSQRAAVPPTFGGGWTMATEPGAGANVALNMLGLPSSPFAPALNGSIDPTGVLHVTGDSTIEAMDLTLNIPSVPAGPLLAPVNVTGSAQVGLHASAGDCHTAWNVSGTLAPPGAAPSATAAAAFSLDLALNYQHHGATSSVCLTVQSAPPQAGASVIGTISGPGVVGPSQISSTLLADGSRHGHFSIDRYGSYVIATKVTSHGVTHEATKTIDVTAAPGQGQCP